MRIAAAGHAQLNGANAAVSGMYCYVGAGSTFGVAGSSTDFSLGHVKSADNFGGMAGKGKPPYVRILNDTEMSFAWADSKNCLLLKKDNFELRADFSNKFTVGGSAGDYKLESPELVALVP